MSARAEARIMTRRHSISEPGLSTGTQARPYRIPHWHRQHRHPDRAGGKVLPGLRRRGAALSPVSATIAGAVRLGADAVGYAL